MPAIIHKAISLIYRLKQLTRNATHADAMHRYVRSCLCARDAAQGIAE